MPLPAPFSLPVLMRGSFVLAVAAIFVLAMIPVALAGWLVAYAVLAWIFFDESFALLQGIGFVLLLTLSPHLGVLLLSFASVWSFSPLPDAYTLAHYATVFQDSSGMVRNTLLYCGLAATLDDLALRVREAGLRSPCLVIVGEVVRLREQLAWFEQAGAHTPADEPAGEPADSAQDAPFSD